MTDMSRQAHWEWQYLRQVGLGSIRKLPEHELWNMPMSSIPTVYAKSSCLGFLFWLPSMMNSNHKCNIKINLFLYNLFLVISQQHKKANITMRAPEVDISCCQWVTLLFHQHKYHTLFISNNTIWKAPGFVFYIS